MKGNRDKSDNYYKKFDYRLISIIVVWGINLQGFIKLIFKVSNWAAILF